VKHAGVHTLQLPRSQTPFIRTEAINQNRLETGRPINGAVPGAKMARGFRRQGMAHQSETAEGSQIINGL
jgi:hypothetical protein